MYLTDHNSRELMVKCGLDALMNGNDSENIVLLSCASNDSDLDLVSTFISAASELNIQIPKNDENDLWVAKTYIELTENKYELPLVEIRVLFGRNLLVIFSELNKISELDQEVSQFNHEFGKFIGASGQINDYLEWLNRLIHLSEAVSDELFSKLTKDCAGLIDCVSYGATTQDDIDESYKVALGLINFNQQREAAEQGAQA